MVAARRAVGRMVDSLMDHDRFTILAFDTAVEYPAHAKKDAHPGHRPLAVADLRMAWQH